MTRHGLLRELAAYLCGRPQSRLRQLAQLRELDDRMLRDIGLTRAQVLRGGPKYSTNPAVEQPPARAVLGQENA